MPTIFADGIVTQSEIAPALCSAMYLKGLGRHTGGGKKAFEIDWERRVRTKVVMVHVINLE